MTPDELSKIVQSLKNGAPGHDGVSSQILKERMNAIIDPLCFLCNRSLEQGVFPDELKLANVLPLFKSGDSMLFNNYHPVSLLCTLSKVFEKVMYSRLLNFLEKHNIIVKNQFGFRRLHSSYMALMFMMGKITAAMDNGDYVIGIFLDFSKAFDTVNHDILLEKLCHYGIRENTLEWFKSYLTNRRQFVTYNGMVSKTKCITCCVPQGSILGPLLFLIYINDLYNVCCASIPILFADDTNLFYSGSHVDALVQNINDELLNISKWLKAKMLSLNIKKTHFIIFHRKKTCVSNLKYKLTTRISKRYIKLGVIIDCKLSWKYHIALVSGKLSRSIGMISKARECLNRKSLLTLYHSFVYPYLT